MKVLPTSLSGVYILEPRVFSDERGYFYESFNERRFIDATGIEESIRFVQDNHSKSAKNVLRGLHYQLKQPQGKLVRVVAGEIFDVVVDLRKSSSTFGKWCGTVLSAENKRQLWIPQGFAHGFVVTSGTAECLYKTTDYWAPEHERCIAWNDPTIGIEWPIDGAPVMSEKDKAGKSLVDAEVFS